MPVEFGCGTLSMDNLELGYINDANMMSVDLALDDDFVNVYPLLSANVEASFECECSVNSDIMKQLSCSPPPTCFTISASIPVMIQARWHKNHRIRKKWLKRYGMKEDTVKVVYDFDSFEYDRGEPYGITGYLYSTSSVRFEPKKIRYELRPEQKRRGIKIEF